MNNTITLSQLITRLAKVADTDIGTARRFLRSFFAAVEEELVNGETVSIKGIGTFRRNTDESFNQNGPVVFIPDTAFADEINAPFAMFEPVELAEDVDFSEVTEEKEPEPLTGPEPEAAGAVRAATGERCCRDTRGNCRRRGVRRRTVSRT